MIADTYCGYILLYISIRCSGMVDRPIYIICTWAGFFARSYPDFCVTDWNCEKIHRKIYRFTVLKCRRKNFEGYNFVSFLQFFCDIFVKFLTILTKMSQSQNCPSYNFDSFCAPIALKIFLFWLLTFRL